MARGFRVLEVDRDGITVSTRGEAAVDVLLDGRRVWSFRVPRDTVPCGRGRVQARWPKPMVRYLDGHARLTLRDSASAAVLHEQGLVLGTSDEPLRILNEDGIDLGVDKSGALVPTFETRPRSDIDALVRATTAVLSSLEAAGARPFVAYGTLLGAVREGAVIGHDSDADVAYVSEATAPVDVIRESFRLQREVGRLGLSTVRYSGAAFKVQVPEADGVERGLDVFAGFFDDGRLYLMGEIGAPFERDWLYPLGTASLEGVDVPVPAQPERLLEATYGPHWRVPDPVFQFTTPQRTTRALTDWFRGLRPGFRYWQRRFSLTRNKMPTRDPGPMTLRAAEEARRTGATVLDVGAGKGADSWWLARQGVTVVAYDYVTVALRILAERVAEEALPLEVRELNLNDWRSVLGEGCRLAHTPGRRVVLAERVVDAIGLAALENLVRFCSMVLREGGTLYAEFGLSSAQQGFEWERRKVDMRTVRAMLRSYGAAQVEVERLEASGGGPATVRLVAQWAP